MERYPNIRKLVKVEFTPQEFMDCIDTVQSIMQKARRRDPEFRLETIGQYFGDHEKAMAFTVRMACMIEMHRSPKAAAFTTKDERTGLMTSSKGIFGAAALAPLHFNESSQFFREEEFFEIAHLEKLALISRDADGE